MAAGGAAAAATGAAGAAGAVAVGGGGTGARGVSGFKRPQAASMPMHRKAMTLRGPNIASDFEALVIDYIEKRYGHKNAAE